MRRLTLPGTPLETSCIGFGCASLGSRVSERDGLTALEAAFDAGVTWYDVAPVYGAGAAEAALGRFLAGRRDRVRVVTKVGLLPPQRSALKRALLPVARGVLGVAGGLRKLLRRKLPPPESRAPIDPSRIADLVEDSLRRLRTDHVDVLALHEPPAAEIADPRVHDALTALVTAGKVRVLAVAGSLDAAVQTARDPGLPFDVIQMADDPATAPLAAVRAAMAETAPERARGLVSHSVFGVGGALEALTTAVNASEEKRRTLVDAGYEGPVADAVADLLMDRAFAVNPNGVVIASMFRAGHRARNIARARLPFRPEAPGLVRSLLS